MAYIGKKTDGDTTGNPLNFEHAQYMTRWLAGTHGTGGFTAYYVAQYITSTAAGKFRGLVLSDNAGSPGTVLGCTYELDVPANSDGTWVVARLKKPIEISDATYYWVSFWYDEALGCRYVAASGQPVYGEGWPTGSYHPNRCYGLSWSSTGFFSITQYASNNFATGILQQGGCVFEYNSTVYAMFVDTTGDLVIYKDLLSAPVLVSTQTGVTIHGTGGTISYIHGSVDGNGVLHVVAAADAQYTRDIAYNQFTLSSETWGTWEAALAAYTDGSPTYPGVALDVDSSNIAHILYLDGVKVHGSTLGQLYYNNRSGGSWGTAELVSDDTTNEWAYPSISLAPAGDIEAFFYEDDTGDPHYRRRNGSWGTMGSYAETAAYVPLNGVVVEADDTITRFHYTSAQDLQENDTSLSITVYSGADRAVVAPSISRAGPLVFYVDGNQDVMVYDTVTNLSTKVLTGTFIRVLAEYSYDYRKGYVNLLIEEGTSNDLLFIRFNKSELITYV